MTPPTLSSAAAPDRALARYQGVRVAVLGASGFIGGWVVRALSESGARVSLGVRAAAGATRRHSLYGVAATGREMDLSVPGSARAFLLEARPSITFNLAGYGIDPAERDPALAYRLNGELLDEVCEAVAATRDPAWPGQHLVHTGSALEYGTAGGDLSEGSVCRPTTLYGASKLAGTERVARRSAELGVRAVCARLFTVFGPGERPGRLLPSLFEAARTGTPLALTSGAQHRDFTYVEDVSAGLVRLGLAPAPGIGIVNLATGRLTSVRSFCESAAEILGIPSERLLFGALPTRAEEMEHAEVAVDRLRRLIGWLPSTSVAEGIRRTADFDREIRLA